MKLVFGFERYPYSARFGKESPLTATTKKKASVRARRSPYGAGKTTDEVAEQLEGEYGIVEDFYEKEEDYLVDLFEESFAEQIEEVMAGVEVPKERITTKETNKIETKFKYGLMRELYHKKGSVPTEAAKKGVSHLRAHPYAKGNPQRPSFVDTGMYMRSFRAWIEEDDK